MIPEPKSIPEDPMLARVATFDHLDPNDVDSNAVQRLRDTVRSTAWTLTG